MAIQKQTILKWLFTSLWISIGAGVLILLGAGIKKEDQQNCTGVTVNIKGATNNFFVDKNDILNAIDQYIDGPPKGQPIGSFNLKSMEMDLQKNIWVKQVQMFFDNNAVLQVNVLEREPVARVFNLAGNSFYIDSSLKMLPLSEKFSARLPVFTSFPSDKMVLSKADSSLLKEIAIITAAIQKDPFRMAMIEQVDITPQRGFEMLPKIGNTTIILGSANDVESKLQKLQLFYKNIITKAGWNYYSTVDLRYNNQVVAKRKDAADVSSDSLRTLQLMQLIAYNAELQSSDSLQTFAQDNERNTTNVNLIQQSLARDDENEQDEPGVLSKPVGIPVTNVQPLAKPVVAKKPVVAIPAKPTVTAVRKAPSKPVVKKPVTVPVIKKPVIVAKPVNKPAVITKPTAIKSVVKPAVKPKNDY